MKTVNNLKTMRHSCEHVLTQAMLELYPQIKMAMGPATDKGFYFDFDPGKTQISEADFLKIEKKMAEIIRKNLPITKKELFFEEARKLFKNNQYKQEWLDEIQKRGEKAIVYYTGNSFVDLCSGPHLESTAKIGPFKLLSIAGAYWHGDEKNKMLTRIYGTCFPTQKELDQYLWQREEAKKRDHRKLGVKLGLWTFSELVGPGLALFTPKGALVRRLICDFVEELQCQQGIQQVWTPQISKAELFKISGHYDKYKENMFMVKSNYSSEEYFLKPMNCPQHTQIYSAQPRSYKDLPIRMADFAMLYRDEKPGELCGLTRIRSFSQDDCHIFCAEQQVEEEMSKALAMTKKIMDVYGFTYKYRLSLRDPKHKEKYLGDDQTWKKAEALCEKILKKAEISYYPALGEAAFYAPKLDLIATDSLDREWQLSTLQIDYFMPQRFKLVYIDEQGQEKRPVMLHRAISGSPERLIAILLEHFNGSLPTWLSPVQVMIIPISEKQNAYAGLVEQKLKDAHLRVELDQRPETMQKKIQQAEEQKIPYMLILGGREASSTQVSVRQRGEKNLGSMTQDQFLKQIKAVIETKQQI